MWENPLFAWIMEMQGYENPFKASAPKNYMEKRAAAKPTPLDFVVEKIAKIERFATRMTKGLLDGFGIISNYMGQPKTNMFGVEANYALGFGQTGEFGLFAYQEGWNFKFGTYTSKGPLSGYEASLNFGIAGFNLSPEGIEGFSKVYSGEVGGGFQIITSDGDWVGTRFHGGFGLGAGYSEELTEFQTIIEF